MKDEGDYPEDEKKIPMECKTCGSKEHRTSEHGEKKERDGKHEKRKVEEKKRELAGKIKGKKNGADDFSRSDRKKEKKLEKEEGSRGHQWEV